MERGVLCLFDDELELLSLLYLCSDLILAHLLVTVS